MECFIVNSKEIEGRIDPHFYRPEFKSLVNTIKKRPFQKLSELIDFSSETWDQQSIYEDEFPYIEISEIEVNSGEISNVMHYKISDAPSRAKMIVREEDILVSTTRPNRGAIALIDKSKNEFIASTGFAVLRKIKNKQISRKYLFYILRTRLSLTQMLQRTSGGNYPAITSEELEKILIPIPPPETQQKIVRLMDDAYTEKRKKENEAKRLTDSIEDYLVSELDLHFTSSQRKCFTTLFSDVAGRLDPLFYSQDVFSFLDRSKYPVKSLEESVVYLKTGFAAGKKDQDSSSEGIIHIRPTNMGDNGLLKFDRNVYIDKEEASKYSGDLLQKGEVLFNNTNSQNLVGKSAFFDLDGQFFCSNHVTRIKTSEKVIPDYITLLLNVYQKNNVFYKICTNWNNQSGVNINLLKKVKFPVPPLAVQNRIASEVSSRMEKSESLRCEAAEALSNARSHVEGLILGR
jgi:restriction endonuclease S subunit